MLSSPNDYAEVLVCLVAGFPAGRTTICRSSKWCEKHLTELREYLPLKNGIVSPSTACRILWGIDEELFALEFMEWIEEILRTAGIHPTIDEKALRGGGAMEKVKDFRTPMILNAFDTVTGLVVAQFLIQDKDCEITEQTLFREGHFVVMVKKNHSQDIRQIAMTAFVWPRRAFICL